MIELQEENEFVDYYALLDLSPDADEKELRRRIFALYDEARHNLDHRSHRKRFYYVSLYETHLARARHFLLDSERRPRYDSCLRAFQAGQPFDYRALFDKTIAARSAAAAGSAPAPAAEAQATAPTQPAPQPAAPAGAAATAAPAPAPPQAQPVSTPAVSAPAGPTPASPTPAGPGPAAPVAQTQPAAPAEQSESAARLEKLLRTPTLDPEQVGRRRDFQRRELIGGELKAQGRFATLITFSITLLLGTMLLWNLEMSLIYPKDGAVSPTDIVLIVLSLALLCGIAWLAGWYASRLTRRLIIARLSRMSYDELLRHCRG